MVDLAGRSARPGFGPELEPTAIFVRAACRSFGGVSPFAILALVPGALQHVVEGGRRRSRLKPVSAAALEFMMAVHANLLTLASSLTDAWRSRVVGQAAGANLKVVRMDGRAYPDESHAFDEALLVLEGQMNLQIGTAVTRVGAGEVCIVPAGVPHAVAEGSHGTLVIIDSDV
jgi:quercetin dioxygenase-like cupin family protein